MPEVTPKLQLGVGFHLEPDGQWTPKNIPPNVIQHATFSGYLTIKNYRCVVFETGSGDQWAQKVVGNPKLAMKESLMSTNSIISRIATRYIESKKNDLVSQVNEVFDDERGDDEYNEAISNYCDDAFSTIESLNETLEGCVKEFYKSSQGLAAHKHEKVQKISAAKIQQALVEAGESIKAAGNKAIMSIVNDLKTMKNDAS